MTCVSQFCDKMSYSLSFDCFIVTTLLMPLVINILLQNTHKNTKHSRNKTTPLSIEPIEGGLGEDMTNCG